LCCIFLTALFSLHLFCCIFFVVSFLLHLFCCIFLAASFLITIVFLCQLLSCHNCFRTIIAFLSPLLSYYK
jgi:hypothetical protein